MPVPHASPSVAEFFPSRSAQVLHPPENRRVRDRAGTYRVEGPLGLLWAADSGATIEQMVVSPPLLGCVPAQMAVRRLTAAGVPRIRVTPDEFRRLQTMERATGIIAVVRQPWKRLEWIDPSKRGPLGWLLIQRIRSPGNLGTILRSAEAAGLNGAIFLTDPHGQPLADPFDPAAIRAAMGGLFGIELIRASWPAANAWLKRHGIPLVGLSPDGAHSWDRAPIDGPVCLAVGEERGGLSAEIASACGISVRLPMRGRTDSLNVAMATAVMIYELVRRQPPETVAHQGSWIVSGLAE
jgi:TrmH family RNA methyltransferase